MEEQVEDTRREPITPGQDSNAMEALMAKAFEDAGKSEDDIIVDEKQKETEGQADKTQDDSESNKGGEPEGQKDESKPTDSGSDDSSVQGSDKQKKVQEEPRTDEDPFEKEIDSIQLRKGASEKSVGALKDLKIKAKTQYREAKKANEKVKELETQVADLSNRAMPKEKEEQFKKYENFYHAFNIQNDPEFNQKYEKEIESENEAALADLRSWNLPEKIAEFIKSNGGVYEFQVSERLMPEQFKNADGSRMTHAQYWSNQIEANMTLAQKRDMGYRIATIQNALRAKQAALRDAQANRENFLKEREESTKKQSEEFKNRVLAHIPKVLKEIGDDVQLKEVPVDATPEQKAEIEAHNKVFRESQQAAQKYLTDLSPETRTEAAAWAAFGRVVAKKELDKLTKIVQDRDSTIAMLNGQLEKIKKAGKTAGRGTGTKQTVVTGQPTEASASSAMERLMEKRFANS